MDDIRKSVFRSLHKLVVKVGSRILCHEDNTPDWKALDHLAGQLSLLHDQGYAVVLVTSGAVGVGMGTLGYATRPKLLPEKQACAAIGQIRLMHAYSESFAKRGKVAAQILLSGDDFRDRTRFDNIRKTVGTLLAKKVIPIINENDTITTEEIKVGDNDKLSADVAHFLEADLLVILSDEEGLYTGNPKTDREAKLISVVPRITPDILTLADSKSGSKVSVGGMKAKLLAIRQAVEAGTPAVLTRGHGAALVDLVQGQPKGTLFLPNPDRIRGSKRWLAFVSKARGQILLDEGGVKALSNRRSSLLPVGVRDIRGNFKPGDFVEICGPSGEVIGRGRSSYSAAEVRLIRGQKSGRIPELLGRKGPDEVIHRDQLVIY
ncbi:MAG TPA: glutamate 5-kinase [Fibrobacteria bacterium]|nr:glutamate 5-kinase [Fibrobacteria bacterium]